MKIGSLPRRNRSPAEPATGRQSMAGVLLGLRIGLGLGLGLGLGIGLGLVLGLGLEIRLGLGN